MSSVTETINAGTWREFFEPGDFFRLLETTAPVTVEFYAAGRKIVDVVNIQAGYAEYFRGGTLVMFDRVRIYSATTQQVGFVTRFGSDVRYDRGASSVTGTVALDAATLTAIATPKASTGYFLSEVALSANTPLTVFTPASNVNGAILLSADISDFDSTANASISAFLAKSSAPTLVSDGEPLLISRLLSAYSTSNHYLGASLNEAQYIAPGLGLYFIRTKAIGVVAGVQRTCRYRIL
jgi:hypothetical protein